jgi:hypothetical protein
MKRARDILQSIPKDPVAPVKREKVEASKTPKMPETTKASESKSSTSPASSTTTAESKSLEPVLNEILSRLSDPMNFSVEIDTDFLTICRLHKLTQPILGVLPSQITKEFSGLWSGNLPAIHDSHMLSTSIQFRLCHACSLSDKDALAKWNECLSLAVKRMTTQFILKGNLFCNSLCNPQPLTNP